MSSEQHPLPTKMALLLGTVFGTGHLPIAPGTWGSAAALLLVLPFSGPAFGYVTGAGILLVLVFGPALARVAMRVRRKSDPQDFVLDEACGVWIAAFRLERPDWTVLLLAFVLFRLFDMTKPWPINRIERLPRGWGVLHDDVAAGAVALLLGLLIEPYLT